MVGDKSMYTQPIILIVLLVDLGLINIILLVRIYHGSKFNDYSEANLKNVIKIKCVLEDIDTLYDFFFSLRVEPYNPKAIISSTTWKIKKIVHRIFVESL